MADLPSNYGFGLVTGGFALAVGDRDDPGREPDAIAAEGSVLFRPQASRIVIPGERVVTPKQITCSLDAEGYLYLPESVTPDPDTGIVAEADRGVYLVANDTTDATPQGWTYEVTVSLTGQSQWRFPIAVTTGSVQDISSLVPVDSSGGTPIIRGPKGEPGEDGADGIMASIVAGDGITVDDTDPANPVVSAPAGFDTGWLNVITWTDGVQDATGQMGSANTTDYELVGTGWLAVRRLGERVLFASQPVKSGGGGIKTVTNSHGATLVQLPVGYRLSVDLPSGTFGTKVPAGAREPLPLLIGNSYGAGQFGILTPNAGEVVYGLNGSYDTSDPFPA